MAIYVGFMICDNCNVHSNWGESWHCPFCGCEEGKRDE